jgi:hypothetical protein
MAKRGPKRKYDTPEKLQQAIDEYFDLRESASEFPDLAGMRLHLGVTQATLDRYAKDDAEEYEKYRDILEAAKDRRESWLVRRMVTEPKAANGCMSALKQPANGGYIDKPIADSGEKTLTINLVGIAGGEKAFK